MRFLTHKEVLNMAITLFTENGWTYIRSPIFRTINKKPIFMNNTDNREDYILVERGDKFTLERKSTTTQVGEPIKVHGNLGQVHPDAIFVKPPNDEFVTIEVKPEFCGLPEIFRGIGQTVYFLPFKNFRPYLVIPEDWYIPLKQVFSELYMMGVVIYTKANMRVVQQPAEPKS